MRQAKIKEEEELEKKRSSGTPVTPETFKIWEQAWREKFGLNNDKKRKQNRLTGRQMFERNAALALSDVAFGEEGGETVEIDWKLFSKDLEDQLEEEN